MNAVECKGVVKIGIKLRFTTLVIGLSGVLPLVRQAFLCYQFHRESSVLMHKKTSDLLCLMSPICRLNWTGRHTGQL